MKIKTTVPIEMPKLATLYVLGQMNRDFTKVLRTKNAAAAANEPVVMGRTNIQGYGQGLIDADRIDASVKSLNADSDGDLSYEISSFELKLISGDMLTNKGKYTEIVKRNTKSQWFSVYGLWSANGSVH